MQLLEQYMTFIAIGGSLFYFIQAYKIFKTKCTQGLSITAFILNFFIQVSWAVYGWLMDLGLVCLASTLTTIGVLLILIGILKYNKHE